MMFCKICQHPSILSSRDDMYLCKNCSSFYFSGKNPLSNVKNFSNKEAHFKNLVKIMIKLGHSEIDPKLLDDIKKDIDTNTIDIKKVDTKYLLNYSKKDKLKRNYFRQYHTLCLLKETNPSFDEKLIRIFTIVFYDFTNFLARNDKISLTINYQQFLGNIMVLFDINNNMIPHGRRTDIKDIKHSLWEKYTIDLCNRMINNSNTDKMRYEIGYMINTPRTVVKLKSL